MHLIDHILSNSFNFFFLVIFNHNVLTKFSGKTCFLMDFSNHFDWLNPAPFLQSTARFHFLQICLYTINNRWTVSSSNSFFFFFTYGCVPQYGRLLQRLLLRLHPSFSNRWFVAHVFNLICTHHLSLNDDQTPVRTIWFNLAVPNKVTRKLWWVTHLS